MFETAGISDCDGPGETVRELDLVELFLDCLPQFDLVDIAQDEQGFNDLAEGLHRLVEAVLPGIRVQVPEDFRSRGFLELDCGDKAQRVKHDIRTRVMTMLLALFAEVERDLISGRTRESSGLQRPYAVAWRVSRGRGILDA